MPRFEIRLATTSDAPWIAEANIAMALETENKRLDEATVKAGVESLLEHPERGFYLIALSSLSNQPRCAGCLLITHEWSDWRNGFFWWIQSVFVPAEFRRQGVYRQMYAFAKRRADEAGNVRGFRLYVEQDNEIAQRTYEELGMTSSYYRMYEEMV